MYNLKQDFTQVIKRKSEKQINVKFNMICDINVSADQINLKARLKRHISSALKL